MINRLEFDSPLFSSNDRIVEIWDRMQRLQTDFCYPSELPFYFCSKRWRKANCVLDAGTGNGYYLNKLSKFFPTKSYMGIDSSDPLIAIAEKISGKNIKFQCNAFLDLVGSFDAIIMRLFAQHVHDLAEVLETAKKLLAPGGVIVLIDAFDGARCYSPPLPEFVDFFSAYAKECKRRGLGRDVAQRVKTALGGVPGCKLEREWQVYISSASGSNLELFSETYALLIELIELTQFMPYDFDSVRAAWRAWCASEVAYTQVGLNIMEIAVNC